MFEYLDGYSIWRKGWAVNFTSDPENRMPDENRAATYQEMKNTFDENYSKLILELTLPEYAAARTVYHQAIRDQVEGYIESTDATDKHKNDMNEAIAIAYTAVAGIAWHDGGGDIHGAVAVSALLKATIDKEQGYTNGLFERLKLLRSQLQQGDPLRKQFTAMQEGQARAEGYSQSLDYWYALVKLMGMGDTELMFGGPSGNESCHECEMLLNTWHPASWYVANGYVPPRGENLTCHEGGKCEHTLSNRAGQLITL